MTKLSLHVYLSAFVKTYPLGFHLASGAARLQASVVPKNVWGLLSWLVQMNSPGTQCLNTGWVDQAWGAKQVGWGGGSFDTTPSRAVFTRGFDWQVPCSYSAPARPLLRIIIMIIAEFSGRHRQSPSVLGGEGQSLGKDIVS